MRSWIYRLSKDQLATLLDLHGLVSTGSIDALRKRLRQFVIDHPDQFMDDEMPKQEDEATTGPAAHPAQAPDIEPPQREPERPEPAAILNQIRKWGLHFDGKDPFAFMERLDELKRAYGYADNFLLLGLPELLRGDPLLWYRNNRDSWATWADFCKGFYLQYLPPGYRSQMKREVLNRRQQPGEPFSKYATALLTLMRRAGDYTPLEQTEQLYENMDPDYQIYVRPTEATSIAELTTKATDYERIVQRRKNRPGGDKRTPELAVAAAIYDRETCCWRCKQRGHTRLDCKRPPKKFCSRCGKDGVFTRDCHPPAGNSPRVGENTATTRPDATE